MRSPLFVDANILIRCVVGRASIEVDDLRAQGAELATTDAQAREAEKVLHHVFHVSEANAAYQMGRVVSALDLYRLPTYRAHETVARSRIHYKNKRDWPILAAALAHDGDIWTDDRDFFGVGVATWTTRNIRRLVGETLTA